MSLKVQVLTGLKWTSVSTISVAASNVLKISVLARFLDKADFGLMALILFVLGFLNLFSDLGISTAILHKLHITKKTYASLYWLNLFICLIIYGSLWSITPLISYLYDENQLNSLIPLIGYSIIFSGFGMQFKTIETKNLNFKTISIIDILSAIISLILAVILAISGYGILSLIYSSLAQSFLSNLLYFINGVNKYGLLLHFKFRDTLPFLKIGIYQVGGQVANYFNRDIDILLVGKFFSTEILGGYNLAKQLAYRPAQVINPILVKVASPTLAKFQDNLDELKKNYLRLIKIVSSINLPIYLLIIIFAPYIVRIFYGEAYISIVNLVRLLSIVMIFRSIGNPIGSLVIATGKTKLEFIWNIINLLVLPLVVFIGCQFDIVWVARLLIITSILLFIPSWKLLVYKMTGATLKEYIMAISMLNLNLKNFKTKF